MSVDHKRPMYAFVMVALICGLVIADQVRSEARWGLERPFSVVAGAELEPLPTSDPPVPGQPRRTTAGQTTGGGAEAPAAVRRDGQPDDGVPGSSQPPVEVVAPAPEPQAPAAGGHGQAGPGPGGPGGVLEQVDLGETVEQVLESAASSGHPARGHARPHGKAHGAGAAGVRGAGDERGPREGAGADQAGDGDAAEAAVDAADGQDAPDAVTDAGASDEAGAPVLEPVPVLPGWLEDAVSPRSAPAPPRP